MNSDFLVTKRFEDGKEVEVVLNLKNISLVEKHSSPGHSVVKLASGEEIIVRNGYPGLKHLLTQVEDNSTVYGLHTLEILTIVLILILFICSISLLNLIQ